MNLCINNYLVVGVLTTLSLLAAACFAGESITDLEVSNITPSSAVLTWTAPGEGGFIAPDTKYEIRFSAEEITDRTFWERLRLCPDPPEAKIAGAKELYAVEGLNCNSEYYFAVKLNGSLSNVVRFRTPPGIFDEAEIYRLDTSKYAHWEAHAASYVTAVDVNADGFPDLAVVNGEEFLSVMLNNGDGSFASPAHYRGRVGGEATMVAAADFNGDGNTDLAVSYYSEDAMGVFLNYGNGEFYFKDKFGKPHGTLGLCAEDFDRDGDNDIAFVNWDANKITVLYNRDFREFKDDKDFKVGQRPMALCAGDFNGDGLPDIAAACAGPDKVSLLVNNGDGTFDRDRRFETAEDPNGIVAADFDNDNRLDIAAANRKEGSVSVLLNENYGNFDKPRNYRAGENPASLCAADFDNDGKPDIAAANNGSFYPSNISVLMNRGNGSFAEAVNYAAGKTPTSVCAADFDNDGDIDMAATCFEEGAVYVYYNTLYRNED